MRIKHLALSERHAPIGGCLVQRKTDNRAPRGDAIQGDQSPEKLATSLL